jgi:hypothetical protein
LIGRGSGPPIPLLVSLLVIASLGWGCRTAAPTTVGVTFPPAAPTAKPVDGEKVIEGLKAALGPDSPMRFKATADVRVETAAIMVIIDGDFQGTEMDAHLTFRLGGHELAFDVIAADGKAYVRQFRGDWARSPEKLPAGLVGPFGDMSKAKLRFAGPSETDKDLYTIVWTNPTHAARAVTGTVFSSLSVKSAVMNFDVDSAGRPYTASYLLKGTAKLDGKKYAVEITGYYQFFRIHEPLVFESPMR